MSTNNGMLWFPYLRMQLLYVSRYVLYLLLLPSIYVCTYECLCLSTHTPTPLDTRQLLVKITRHS